MKKVISPGKIDVVILCGGEGKRLKSIVKDRPKPMAVFRGRPFLNILIDYVARYGFRRFILCAGYKGEIVERYYKNKKNRLKISVLREDKPLGTAGAIKNARGKIKSTPFLAMNGDSICRLDLHRFINFHKNRKADFSITLVKAKESEGYGVVKVENSGKIASFNEKSKAKRGDFVNAGIYLFEKRIFSLIKSDKKSSLEYDVFPKLITKRFFGYITDARLMDIGTPDRYTRAKKELK